jgi:hypothetical protein
VIEGGDELALVAEHPDELVVVGDLREHALDRADRAALEIARTEDLRHSPDGDALEQLVVPKQLRAQAPRSPSAMGSTRSSRSNESAGRANGGEL